MGKRFRRWGLLSIAGMLMLSLLAACGGNVSDSGAANSGDEKKPVELRIAWFGSKSRTDATLAALDAYTAKNPHVTFIPEYTGTNPEYIDKLSTQAAAKNTPDIMTMDNFWIAEYANRNQLADISEGIDLSDINPSLIEDGKINGILYAVPLATNAFGAVFKEARLKELNIEAPADDWTWDDYYQFGYDVKAKLEPNQYALQDQSDIYTTYTGYQNSMGKGDPITVDGKINLDKETWIGYMNKYTELREAGVVPPAEISVTNKDGDVSLDPLLNGAVVLRYGFSSTLSAYEAVHPGSYNLVPLPRGIHGSSSHVKVASFWSVSPNTKHMDEAKKFIEWWVNDLEASEILGTVRGLPVATKVIEHVTQQFSDVDKKGAELAKKVAVDAAPFSIKAEGWSPFYQKDYPLISQQVMFGQKSPEDAYEELLQKAAEYVK